jgi:succinylglutamate desuccinylase
MTNRIIGRYEGPEKGPLFICLGGIHGNETAGPKAIEKVFRLLEEEPSINPAFRYKGVLLGLSGNLAALNEHQRFINRDLNRMMTSQEATRIFQEDPLNLSIEDKEFMALIEIIAEEKRRINPTFTLILDLHTTTADGGIFTIAAEDEMSTKLAKGLHAPVVLGIAEILKGTTINYFNEPFSNNHCIVFEAGQHEDPFATHRSVAAIINCMRSIGAVDPGDVDHKHDGLLIDYSLGLPKVSRLVFHYKIKPGENFVMMPGYKNFQQIHAGEILAHNESGAISSPVDGLILMPKYQSRGEDGFFIIEVAEP